MSQNIDRFTIAEFTNPSGKTAWRLQGRKPEGVRVRKNFKPLAAARAQKHQLDIEWLNWQAGSSFRHTRLTDQQLAEAETAFLQLGGKPCWKLSGSS